MHACRTSASQLCWRYVGCVGICSDSGGLAFERVLVENSLCSDSTLYMEIFNNGNKKSSSINDSMARMSLKNHGLDCPDLDCPEIYSLGAYNMGAYNIASPILDLSHSMGPRLQSGGLQSGGLQSRTTNLGSCSTTHGLTGPRRSI